MRDDRPTRLRKWRHQLIMGSALMLAVGLGCGCAHYGWTSTGVALNVETVAVRADEGLAPGELTRRLVAQLHREGLDARWNGEATRTLVCSVEIVEVSASTMVAPTAEATCVVERRTITARSSSAATVSNDIGSNVRSARQRAAESAMDAIAPIVRKSLVDQE